MDQVRFSCLIRCLFHTDRISSEKGQSYEGKEFTPLYCCDVRFKTSRHVKVPTYKRWSIFIPLNLAPTTVDEHYTLQVKKRKGPVQA